MKRDLDLIKKILEEIENRNSITPSSVIIQGEDNKIVQFQCRLLIEGGFLKGTVTDDWSQSEIWIGYITWQGYEFLQLSRNNTIWKKAKDVLKEKALTVPVDVLIKMLKMYLEQQLKLG